MLSIHVGWAFVVPGMQEHLVNSPKGTRTSLTTLLLSTERPAKLSRKEFLRKEHL